MTLLTLKLPQVKVMLASVRDECREGPACEAQLMMKRSPSGCSSSSLHHSHLLFKLQGKEFNWLGVRYKDSELRWDPWLQATPPSIPVSRLSLHTRNCDCSP